MTRLTSQPSLESVEVDHAAPIHDGFCRCRVCKPSPVGRTSSSLARIRMAAIMLVAVGGLVVVERAAS